MQVFHRKLQLCNMVRDCPYNEMISNMIMSYVIYKWQVWTMS